MPCVTRGALTSSKRIPHPAACYCKQCEARVCCEVWLNKVCKFHYLVHVCCKQSCIEAGKEPVNTPNHCPAI